MKLFAPKIGKKKLSYIGITEHKKDVYNHIQRVRKFGEQIKNVSICFGVYYGGIISFIQIYYSPNKKCEKHTIFVTFGFSIKLYFYFY
ncbi:hypothetical protein HMP0015_0546 [Acinetobacter haemolyticus ATCC 19194]|uniref:Uncharacterized protein n=1 Tax=Acinetobacter haemolyticus ATCC 19194 TaxID=707232 RepID=D4XLF4_ACIHA|nr:hypothetical protein HMP0015_0546 [Acinetobacter haemolyticus ATCC 19194]